VEMGIVFSAARHTIYVCRISIKDSTIQIALHVTERVGNFIPFERYLLV
jgi:hypothetical protein